MRKLYYSTTTNCLFKETNQVSTNQLITGSTKHLYRLQKSCTWATEVCNFKIDVIKWWLNFLLCNFGLKSYLWFQIKLVLCTHFILKSLIWFQTKLQSTQFNYHYLSWSSVPEPLPYPFPPVRPGNGWPHCRVFCCSVVEYLSAESQSLRFDSL